jgi:hypothetical protein
VIGVVKRNVHNFPSIPLLGKPPGSFERARRDLFKNAIKNTNEVLFELSEMRKTPLPKGVPITSSMGSTSQLEKVAGSFERARRDLFKNAIKKFTHTLFELSEIPGEFLNIGNNF